jgi:hypothetical protein
MKTIPISQTHPNELIFSTQGEATLELVKSDSPAQALDWEVVKVLNDESLAVEGYILRP